MTEDEQGYINYLHMSMCFFVDKYREAFEQLDDIYNRSSDFEPGSPEYRRQLQAVRRYIQMLWATHSEITLPREWEAWGQND